ncbi:SseB family protein [Streptomyces boncukensis]|uniref:SseB family protein n=1 Tax=Streptomyces boncukensis TaxID=2711219 RepID=A0A6G4X2R7_9ACTN|nr:SseB family protein [Streptomyces boncukensis]NGO71678.1 SseB family protein [Streptomyces boncukensis]
MSASLRALVQGETAASLPRAERLAAARAVRLYFQRPEHPGFLVTETGPDGPAVPVFSSLRLLALFAGPCAWASTTAEDLAELLPEGVSALVDPLGPEPGPYLLDAAALRGTGP